MTQGDLKIYVKNDYLKDIQGEAKTSILETAIPYGNKDSFLLLMNISDECILRIMRELGGFIKGPHALAVINLSYLNTTMGMMDITGMKQYKRYRGVIEDSHYTDMILGANAHRFDILNDWMDAI